MSLRHALLVTLTAQPMTGYELIKYFDGSIAFVWNAPHSQIYPELRRMEREGLVDVEVVPRGERAEKRVYSINAAGTAELRRWYDELIPYQAERDPYRLKAAHFEQGSYDAARGQLHDHLSHYSRALQAWENVLADLDARRITLTRERLARRPEAEHEAIVAFRKFAFEGEVAKAKAEIEWARRGLALLDDLEQRGVPLTGEVEAAAESADGATPES